MHNAYSRPLRAKSLNRSDKKKGNFGKQTKVTAMAEEATLLQAAGEKK